jgi:hypothetical protein
VHRGGRVAVAGRVLHVSTTFRRSLTTLGVRAGSPGYRAVSATLHALASGNLPGAVDYETRFTPGTAHVRRVPGHNLWILYRFDDARVFVMTSRRQPPVPLEEPE